MTDVTKQADQGESLRGNLYSLLAALLAKPPARSLMLKLQQIGTAGSGGEILESAWQQLKKASQEYPEEEVEKEYFQLFTGLGRGELVPYGSFYISGFLMDEPLGSLRQSLAALGIERQEHIREPEDHIASLFEVMAMLISQPEEYSLDSQYQFFCAHIDSWAGNFFSDLATARQAGFYRSVGSLGLDFMKLEQQYLNIGVKGTGS